MTTRLAKAIIHGLVFVALPLAAGAADGNAEASPPAEMSPGKEYAVIGTHVFHVIGSGGAMSSARLVLEKGAGLLSCFTQPPASIIATQGVGARIDTAEGTYICFQGRGALEKMALDKQLVRTGPAPVAGQPLPAACSGAAIDFGRSAAGSIPKFRGLEDEEDEWNLERQQLLELEFWSSFAAGVRGPRCMSECSTALGAALRFCAMLPDPARELCILGAVSLYVGCISSCGR